MSILEIVIDDDGTATVTSREHWPKSEVERASRESRICCESRKERFPGTCNCTCCRVARAALKKKEEKVADSVQSQEGGGWSQPYPQGTRYGLIKRKNPKGG